MEAEAIETYRIEPSPRFPDILTLLCLICGRRTYNQNDVEQKYCGYCYLFHEGAGEF